MESEAQSEPVAVAKPKRRWWQYSVSSLLVFMAFVAIWLGIVRSSAEKQRRAVEVLHGLGGYVAYESDLGERKMFAPRWLQQAVGKDYFESVIEVRLLGVRLNDASLEHLSGLTRLDILDLEGSSVSDASLAKLDGLTVLGYLDLTGTQIGDDGLAHLKGRTGLAWLSLRKTRVTDSGLEHLKGLTGLEVLILERTQVSDSGIAELQATLPHCRIVR